MLDALSIYNDTLSSLVKQSIREERDLTPKNVDLHDIENEVTSYQNWLADKLSCTGEVDPDDVYSYLEHMVAKYK